MNLAYGSPADIISWMELVNLVSRNFPGLETSDKIEEHKQTVLKFMDRKEAICVKDNEKVTGVLLFSKKHNMICCLAVSPDYRRRGEYVKLGRGRKDFGKGFYMAVSKGQAIGMMHKKYREAVRRSRGKQEDALYEYINQDI